MNEVIAEYFSTIIELFISAFFVTQFVVVMSLASQTSESISRQSDTAQEMREYREINQWDDKDVSQADVIQAILSNRGFPGVCVVVGGSTYRWDRNSTACGYTAGEIGTLVSNDYYYHATIDTSTNSNGELVSIKFEAIGP